MNTSKNIKNSFIVTQKVVSIFLCPLCVYAGSIIVENWVLWYLSAINEAIGLIQFELP